MKPEELLFAETHEWAKVAVEDGAKVATVGISAFAVEQLTDLVYMELPSVGMAVEAVFDPVTPEVTLVKFKPADQSS